MKNEFIAHIKKNLDGSWSQPHLLEKHLTETAKKAGDFAAQFDNKDWGELIGYWHDLGKFHPIWQIYIRKATGYQTDESLNKSIRTIHHSTAGATLALEKFKNSPAANIVAYSIAGHHAGLPDWYGHLKNRLYEDSVNLLRDDLDEIIKNEVTKKIIDKEIPTSIPSVFTKADSKEKFIEASEHLHLWVRMLFSSLVDADFLDTENYMDEKERGNYSTINQLKEKFDNYMKEMSSNAGINRKRNEILNLCRMKAKLPPGFYSLNVPTGGGKTLSSMGFAFEHAIAHNKQRIIMAIPYTSIIEQTAKIFKYGTDNNDELLERIKTGKILFGEDQVVEHHSNLDPEKETYKNKLASENWDAPIIVTTNVQLFESLFANKTTACRKIHNLANSIIILDEAQMLQPEYLKPIVSVLNGLVNHFGVTVLLMTATQPALEGTIGSGENRIEGISNITHIIEDPKTLAKNFERVQISLPKNFDTFSEWEDIAGQLQNYEQVLCIVNRRSDCRELHSLMPKGTVHLSAYMCGEERSEVISDIKEKLRNDQSIRVISTQLVEAGVDIDFPVVYRALAGLDSIAQAAGRCNRENKLKEKGMLGKVIVFNPPKPAPRGLLRKGEDACKSIIRSNAEVSFSPSLFTDYFKYFYSNLNTFDEPRFHKSLVKDAVDFIFEFKTFAQNFHLIDDSIQKSIVVWYSNSKTGTNSEKLINQLQFGGPSKVLNRKLQRYIVNVPLYIFEKIPQNYIKELNGFWVQSDPNLYKPGLGLMVDEKDWFIGNGVV